MKKLFLAIIFLSVVVISYSQSPLSVGKAQLNLGVGLSGWGIPFYAGVDYSILKDITIGGELSVSSYNENWNGNSYHHNIMGVSGNGNYHFNTILNIPRKFDFYAGLNLGYYAWSSSAGYGGNHTSGIGLGVQVGGRYYLSNKVGLNLELGGESAFSSGKFGVSIKI